MQTHEALTTLRLLRWQARNILVFTSLSVVIVIAEELTGEVAGLLPDAPVTILGAAIGIFVSFRTNSAYDRWWEGRKLWGQLVNTSRHFTAQVLSYLTVEQGKQARLFVLNQILYVHALRCELRGEVIANDSDVRRIANECEVRVDPTQVALTTPLLRKQLHDLAQLANHDQLDARRMQTLDASIATLLDVQGGCERIRNTPLPPNYGRIAEILIRAHAVLLPLAIIDDLHWLAIPVSIVVCLSFKLINEVGRVLEDPFTKDWDALPLHALSRTIERNLRDAIGDTAPPPAKPDRNGVLL